MHALRVRSVVSSRGVRLLPMPPGLSLHRHRVSRNRPRVPRHRLKMRLRRVPEQGQGLGGALPVLLPPHRRMRLLLPPEVLLAGNAQDVRLRRLRHALRVQEWAVHTRNLAVRGAEQSGQEVLRLLRKQLVRGRALILRSHAEERSPRLLPRGFAGVLLSLADAWEHAAQAQGLSSPKLQASQLHARVRALISGENRLLISRFIFCSEQLATRKCFLNVLSAESS